MLEQNPKFSFEHNEKFWKECLKFYQIAVNIFWRIYPMVTR